MNFVAQQMLPCSEQLAFWAELINTLRMSSEAALGLVLILFLLSSHKSCWTQLDSEKEEKIMVMIDFYSVKTVFL